MSKGASATQTGLSPQVEPASGLDGSATSIPSACRAPLQPAAGFIHALASRFQEAHVPPLSRDRALLMAVEALAATETDCGPFNHPDFDWSLEAAADVADEQIRHWEVVDGHS